MQTSPLATWVRRLDRASRLLPCPPPGVRRLAASRGGSGRAAAGAGLLRFRPSLLFLALTLLERLHASLGFASFADVALEGASSCHASPPNARTSDPSRAIPRLQDRATPNEKARMPLVHPGLRGLRGVDLNHRPRGYEPRELPGCSTPRRGVWLSGGVGVVNLTRRVRCIRSATVTYSSFSPSHACIRR